MEIILLIVYTIVGVWGVKYFKREILGIVIEFDSIYHHLLRNIVYGVLLGWIAAPISFIHWLFIGRNR